MSRPDIHALIPIVRTVAREELLPRFNRVRREFKADGSVVTAVDLAVQERLRLALAERWPEIGFLGEEMSGEEQHRRHEHAGGGLWVLDPLDGTSNFAAGIPYYSISLALVADRQVVLGLVYDPERDEMFQGERGRGAWLNGEPLKAVAAGIPLQRCMAAVDFKRLSPTLARRLAEVPPYSSQRSFGSVALDWCWLAADRFHVYLHGRQKLWDYAAGLLILEEAGGHAITLEGEPVFTGTMAPRSALAALDGSLFNEWRSWIMDGSAVR